MQREINRNHTGDWDEQRERLSAYLDNELDEGEREALERHLPTCEQCQRTLDEFRMVRSLLRAMPMPAPSHSFVIPTEGTVPVPLAAATRDRSERAEHQQQRTHRSIIWSSVAQAAGRFVAAAGMILVLGSVIMGQASHSLHGRTQASGSAASSAPAYGQRDTTSTAYGSQQPTPKSVGQDKGVPTPTAGNQTTGAPAPTAGSTGGSTPTEGTDTRHTYGIAAHPEDLPVVPIGAGMIAGGGVLFVAGRVSGKRRKRGRD